MFALSRFAFDSLAFLQPAAVLQARKRENSMTFLSLEPFLFAFLPPYSMPVCARVFSYPSCADLKKKAQRAQIRHPPSPESRARRRLASPIDSVAFRVARVHGMKSKKHRCGCGKRIKGHAKKPPSSQARELAVQRFGGLGGSQSTKVSQKSWEGLRCANVQRTQPSGQAGISIMSHRAQDLLNPVGPKSLQAKRPYRA